MAVHAGPATRRVSVANLLVSALLLSCGANDGSNAPQLGFGGSSGGAMGDAGQAGASGNPGTGGTPGGGTSGGAGTAGTGSGSGGSGAPPSGISFDWPETDPSKPGVKCKAGRYVGIFQGMYASPASYFPTQIPVSGNIEMVFAESASGEFLEISNGKLSGVSNFTYPFSADIVGKLNCKTSKLEGGYLKNGTYSGPALPPQYYEGPISADYDKLTAALVNGLWNVKEPDPAFGGNGTWNASWQP